jgi:hypothetical protein
MQDQEADPNISITRGHCFVILFRSLPLLLAICKPHKQGTIIEILIQERACLRCSCKHFGRKNPCKKSAYLHPRQSNLLHWNIFTGLNKTSLHFTK